MPTFHVTLDGEAIARDLEKTRVAEGHLHAHARGEGDLLTAEDAERIALVIANYVEHQRILLEQADMPESQPRAYAVVHFDIVKAKVSRVCIYSVPSKDLTQQYTTELTLDGPSAAGDTLEEAKQNLLKQLRLVTSWRWLYAMLSEGDRR